MKQVAIYAYKNVITTGWEVPAQIDECTHYAERMGFEIVKGYADTGTRQQREKLLKDSRKEKFSRGALHNLGPHRTSRPHPHSSKIV